MLTDQRLARIERELRKQRPLPATKEENKLITEKEAMALYGIGHERLRQLRVGTWHKGRWYPPVLFKWGIKGRRVIYDALELAAHFNPVLITQ